MNKFAQSKKWPYAGLVTGIMCIAWSAIFVRWTSISGPASAFYRLLIPAIVLLPTFLLPGSRKKLSMRNYGIIAIGGLCFALDLAFYNTSILKTSAANATLLGNNTPVVVGILTWLVFRRTPNISFWIGLVLALAGSFVIVSADFVKHVKFGMGDFMALAAAACFAVYLMVTEELRAHTTTLQFLRLAVFSSTIFMFLIALALRIPLEIPDRQTFLALLGLGLISQLGGYLALTYAMGHLPATVTSLSLLSQGPLTAVLAALFLAEPPTIYQIAGGSLVLFGVGLANRFTPPYEPPSPGSAKSPVDEQVAETRV